MGRVASRSPVDVGRFASDGRTWTPPPLFFSRPNLSQHRSSQFRHSILSHTSTCSTSDLKRQTPDTTALSDVVAESAVDRTQIREWLARFPRRSAVRTITPALVLHNAMGQRRPLSTPPSGSKDRQPTNTQVSRCPRMHRLRRPALHPPPRQAPLPEATRRRRVVAVRRQEVQGCCQLEAGLAHR